MCATDTERFVEPNIQQNGGGWPIGAGKSVDKPKSDKSVLAAQAAT
jgi:hypothetical protein